MVREVCVQVASSFFLSKLFKDLCPPDLMECCRIEFKGDMVVATPDIYQVPLTSDVEFIILASDGLWDYMKRFPLLLFFCFTPSSYDFVRKS